MPHNPTRRGQRRARAVGRNPVVGNRQRPAALLVVTRVIVIGLIASTGPGVAVAAGAPGGPGHAPVWAPAAKDFLGTAAPPGSSRVYFTGAEGVLTEVFYPTLDRVQNVDLQLIVVDAARTWDAKDAEER